MAAIEAYGWPRNTVSWSIIADFIARIVVVEHGTGIHVFSSQPYTPSAAVWCASCAVTTGICMNIPTNLCLTNVMLSFAGRVPVSV